MNRVPFVAFMVFCLGLFVVLGVMAQEELADETVAAVEATSEEVAEEEAMAEEDAAEEGMAEEDAAEEEVTEEEEMAEEDAAEEDVTEEVAAKEEMAEEDVAEEEMAEEEVAEEDAVEEVATLDYPESYREWTHIKSMIIHPNHELAGLVEGFHHIYANEIALEGYLAVENETEVEEEVAEEETSEEDAEFEEEVTEEETVEEEVVVTEEEVAGEETAEEDTEGAASTLFPDGSVIVFDLLTTSFDAGAITEGPRKAVIAMERDSERFPDTGGWGFQIFAADEAHTPIETDGLMCFGCHTAVEDNDFVFSTYRP